MELLPAALIGGPPHSGKSVLAYLLTRALRERAVDHYVLRAYPDGEGDWSYEAELDLVRQLRVKGDGTPEWIDRVSRDVANRHLPLIVDAGGRPTEWQAALFDRCTHAILLTPDARSQAEWRRRIDAHNLPLLADLHSALAEPDRVEERHPVLRGRIGGLERSGARGGAAFSALVDVLAALFAYDRAELRALHLAQAPADLVIELERLGRSLPGSRDGAGWQPAQLRTVLTYAPAHTPLAIYERGPNWLYAALAVHTLPAALHQFDPRLGWVSAPVLRVAPDAADGPLRVEMTSRGECVWLEASVPGGYVDYAEAGEIRLPALPAGQGVVLSGKLPMWLYTGLARAYHAAPWLAVYQPQLGHQAVVVASRTRNIRVGQLIG